MDSLVAVEARGEQSLESATRGRRIVGGELVLDADMQYRMDVLFSSMSICGSSSNSPW